MTLLTIHMYIWFLLYVALVKYKFGVLSSISASSYRWKGKAVWLFVAWLGILGAMNFFQNMGYWDEFMSLGLIAAGFTYEHKWDKARLEDDVHTWSTAAAIVLAFLALFILYGIWIPAAMMFVGTGLLLMFSRNWIWYTEILAMTLYTVGCLMR